MATWTQHQPIGIAALTERQREVLGHIASGKTNPEIATLLGVSLPGVKWHVREVITKLGVETREDAAEIWRDEHSLPRRLSKMFGGAMGLGALKVTLGTSAAAAVAVAGIGTMRVVQDMRTTDAANATAMVQSLRANPEQEHRQAAALAASVALYSEAEASQVALVLAMAELETYFVPQRATFDGRPFAVSDLRVVSARFIPMAGRVQFQTPESTWLFGDGRDVWAFELEATGFNSPELGSYLAMSVVIEDGGDRLLSRSISWPESGDPGVMHYSPLVERVGTITALDGQEFPLAAQNNRSFWTIGLGSYSAEGALLGGGNSDPVEPGDTAHSTGEIFGLGGWTAMGYGHMHGAVGPNVVRIEAVTEDGRTATTVPQTPPAGSLFPYRVFAFAFPGAHWVVAARAFDENGAVVGTANVVNHVWTHHDHVISE